MDGLISFIDIDPEEARILSEINSSAHETLLPFLRNRFGSQCQLKLVVLAVGKATEVKAPRDNLDTYRSIKKICWVRTRIAFLFWLLANFNPENFLTREEEFKFRRESEGKSFIGFSPSCALSLYNFHALNQELHLHSNR